MRRDDEFAQPFDEIDNPPSQAELLHYINHKLGHTNALLSKILYWAQFLGAFVVLALGAAFARYHGWI